MKSPLFSVFIVASVMVAIAHCLPRATRDRKAAGEEFEGVDTVLVLPNRGNPFMRPSLQVPDLSDFSDDSDSFEGYNPFGINFNPLRNNPLDGFLESMQSVMNRIREQMAGVLSGLPGQGAFAPWGQIPEGGNTTSTTKIIDGHVVTVNETTYQNGDDNSNTVFRIRTVDVKPLNNQTAEGNDGAEDVGGGEEIETVTSGADANKEAEPEETTQARSVETVEEIDNKIPSKSIDDNLTA